MVTRFPGSADPSGVGVDTRPARVTQLTACARACDNVNDLAYSCPTVGPVVRQRPQRGTLHELSIAQSVVDAVCERAAGRSVHSVRLRVGALTAVVPEAMQFCFDLAVEGTVAEGARLDIE